ncbi:MAG: hypothetical protein ACI97B_000610, partial [Verrucomicrobiales bacterium]
MLSFLTNAAECTKMIEKQAILAVLLAIMATGCTRQSIERTIKTM